LKGKRVDSIILLAMLVIGMFAVIGGVSAAGLPYVYAWPASIKYQSATYCTYNNTLFTVEVKVANVTDCYGVDFWLTYNSTLIIKNGGVNIAGPFASGNPPIRPDPILYPGGYVLTDLSVAGTVKVSLTFVGAAGAPSFNGTGTVCAITFKIIYCPTQIINDPQINNTVSCALAFDDTKVKIWNPAGGAQAKDPSVNGYYEYTTEGKVPGTPLADFDWSPKPVYVGNTVTLTDKSSAGGPSNYIVSWLWQIVGDGTLTGANDTSTTTFHCDAAGFANVTLTIVNNDGKNSTVTKSIEQQLALGAIFDLYTSPNRFCGINTTNIGTGTDQPCDALTPDVNVTLFASVSWNGKPVMHVLVAFVVFDNTGACVLYRTAETDKDGIAEVWFRVPNPCTGPLFGKWIAIASCKYQEEEHKDTMPFDVGYAITIMDAFTTDDLGNAKDSFHAPCDYLGVNVTVKNIMWIPRSVSLVFVVYDDCDVPIGQIILNTTIPGGQFCSPKIVSIVIPDFVHLPQWTYVGRGKVYVSAFTRLPEACGVPYCPEFSYTFALVYP